MRKIKQLLAVLLFFTSLAATAQRVKGKVYDALTGLPLIGASVSVEGKIIGDVSDRDGNYDFRLDAGSYRLKVSFLGYQTELIPFRMGVADYKLDIPLKEATDLLGEVAIVGSKSEKNKAKEATVVKSTVKGSVKPKPKNSQSKKGKTAKAKNSKNKSKKK